MRFLFFQSGKIPRGINHTLKTLIPKVKNVESIKDIYPIGLCNVFYKIISKVLTNHLQPFMNAIVGPKKNAFIKGYLITENILTNHEMVHNLKSRRKGKNHGMVIKLDIIKAYECVEWMYFRHAPLLGFS